MKLVLLLSLLVGIALSVKIEPKFDSRTGFPNCVGEIQNQGSCGSCWSFGAAESFTDRNCINGMTEFQTQNQLANSPEDIVACDSQADGCNGGWAQSAWSIIANGISTCLDTCTAGCHPYTSYNCSEGANGANNGCEACPGASCSDKSKYAKYAAGDNGAITAHSQLTVVEAMQLEIQTNGPVESCFTVYQNFFSFFDSTPDGIYTKASGPVLGGHCIKIIGWDNTNSPPYWIIANSWGADWGDAGFFKYIAGKDLGGMDSGGYVGCPANTKCALTFPSDVEANSKGIFAGGWTKVSPSALPVQQAFAAGKEMIMSRYSTIKAQQISIKEAWVQTVAGINVKLEVIIESAAVQSKAGSIHAFVDLNSKVTIKELSL